MLDESNVLFVQDIQKNCNEPVWTSSSLFHLLSKGSGYGYILKYLNKSIGYILLRSLNDEEEVLSLGVLELNRRQGFASKLFYEFERAVIRKNVLRIFCRVVFPTFLPPGRRIPLFLTPNSDSTWNFLPGTGWKGLEFGMQVQKWGKIFVLGNLKILTPKFWPLDGWFGQFRLQIRILHGQLYIL